MATAPKGAAPEEKSDVRDSVTFSKPPRSPQQKSARLHARLHPIWTGGRDGYRYSVLFDGQLLVERSRDPETDAARALLAKGVTGKLTMLDGKTGRPRTVIDIERAAGLQVREGPLRLAPVESRPNSPYSPETGVVEAVVAERKRGAR